MPLFGTTSINITSRTTQKEFNDFVSKVDADKQLRATEIKNKNGDLIGYKLYAKKSSKTGGDNSSFWNADRVRPDKFRNARIAVNYMLKKDGDDANLLAQNQKMMDGLQLKGMVQKDMLVVNQQTRPDDLKQVGATIGGGKEVHGRANRDGTITLFGASSSESMDAKKRKAELAAVSHAVDKVMYQASGQHGPIYGKMLGAYFHNTAKSTRTEQALYLPTDPVKGDAFKRRVNGAQQAVLEHSVQNTAKALAPQLNQISNELFNRQDLGDALKPGQGGNVNDPLRQDNKNKVKTNDNLTNIQAGKIKDVKTPDLFDSISHIASNSPTMPLNKLASLANSHHVSSAVGLYSGKNTLGKQPIQTPPNQDAARRLRDEINQNLTPQEKAQLKARVELMAKMSDVYATHQPNLPGFGDDIKAKHAKSMAVKYSMWTGHSALDVNAAIGGTDREAGIKARDLMTALVIHKDIVFPLDNQQAANNSVDPDLGRVVRGDSIDAQSQPDLESNNVITIGGNDDNDDNDDGSIDAHSQPNLENENVITIGGDNDNPADNVALDNHQAKLGAWQQLLENLGHQIDTSALNNGLQDLTQGVGQVTNNLQTIIDEGPSMHQMSTLSNSMERLANKLEQIQSPTLVNLRKELDDLRQTLATLVW